MTKPGAAWLVVACATLVGAACGNDRSTGGGGTASTGSGSGTGGTSSTNSTSSTGTGAGTLGYCAKSCLMQEDCCPPGLTGCPGTSYPTNYHCTNGACQAPQCSLGSECTAISPKLDCMSIGGFHTCVFFCTDDSQCQSPTTCSGVDDSQKKFCLAAGNGCQSDTDCGGNGFCKDKACVCEKAGDCKNAATDACAK